MNYAEKMMQEARLMKGLADWMEKHGKVLSDRQQDSPYVGIRIREIAWRGSTYEVMEVDGLTCWIKRI